MKESTMEVVDVATKKKYVPPHIEVVELEAQGAILMSSTASGKSLWGNSLIDDGEEWAE